jgi:hypothetical protein
MYEIKKIDIWSAAKITALIAVIFSIIPFVVSFIPVLFGIMGTMGRGAPFAPFLFLLGPLFFPVFFGVIGFIQGAIGAFLYNLVSEHITGGVEVEIVLKEKRESGEK